MVKMILPCAAVNKNIIKKNYHKFAEERSKEIIHGCHEGRGDVCQAEWHDKELKVTVDGSECCFMLIRCCNANLVKPKMKVYLEELSGSK